MANKPPKRDWIEEPQAPAAPGSGAARAERLEGLALHALVFTCGTGLMGLEIVGGRALLPYFGSSVFVWGAIIGIFMAALALGYYLGGLVADRKPSLGWLAAIVGLAGMMVLALTQVSIRVCNRVDLMNLGPQWGPLVASLLLYFPPSLFLGAVSPFAVRLQAKAVGTMGNVAGRLYALSTAGSLLGTVATTFWLIPAMGTVQIFYLLGALILAAAALALAARFAARGGPRTPGAAALTILFMAVPLGLAYFLSPVRLPGSIPTMSGVRLYRTGTDFRYLVSLRESPYHTIAVVQEFNPCNVARALQPALDAVRAYWRVGPDPAAVIEFLGKGEDLPPFNFPRPMLDLCSRIDPQATREIRFNDLTESSFFLNKPGHVPATAYTRILHLGLALHPEAKNILVVGLGGGSVPREFCDLYGEGMKVDAVDIDAAVLQTARESFFFKDEPGGAYQAFIDDGRQFIRRGKGRFDKYDLIILDAYSGGGQIPPHLVTREFLEQCRARLAPNGVLASNIISTVAGERGRLFRSYYKTMAQVFDTIYVFPKDSGRWAESTRNLILVAPLAPGARLDREELVAKAEALVECLKARAAQQLAGEALKARNEQIDLLALPACARNYYSALEPAELADAPVFTDNHAPVETMFWMEPNRGNWGRMAYRD